MSLVACTKTRRYYHRKEGREGAAVDLNDSMYKVRIRTEVKQTN
jgi:hypothetical protein